MSLYIKKLLSLTVLFGLGLFSIPSVNANYVAQRNFNQHALLRVAGNDRYATAVAVSQYGFTTEHTSSAIVVASGENFPDALTAAPLAAILNAPLLLTKSTELPSNVANEISRVFDGVKDSAPDIYIVGGQQAISNDVTNALAGLNPNLDLKRIAGADRVATAALVAGEMDAIRGTTPSALFLTTGNNFPDALAASGPASDKKIDSDYMPILLNRGTDSLDASVQAAVEAYLQKNISAIYILGGNQALSDALLSQLNGLVAGTGATTTIVRYAGPNRYATAGSVAERFYGSLSPTSVAIVSGENFPDALVGGRDSGLSSDSAILQPVVMVRQNQLPSETSSFINTHSGTLDMGVVYGGIQAVSDQTQQSIEAIL